MTSSSGASHQSLPAQAQPTMPAHGTLAIQFVPPEQTSPPDSARHQKASHTQQREQKSASASIHPVVVQKWTHASSSTLATGEAVKETTQHPGAPLGPSLLSSILTPLRLLKFKEELRNHPNPAWVSDILTGIDKGVPLGYHGPRCQRISRNLTSAFQHPEIIDNELYKEITAKRIIGPF